MADSESLEVLVNDFKVSAPVPSTVEMLLEQLKEADPHMIVELNGRLVYPKRYATTEIRDGDRVEIINPDFGG